MFFDGDFTPLLTSLNELNLSFHWPTMKQSSVVDIWSFFFKLFFPFKHQHKYNHDTAAPLQDVWFDFCDPYSSLKQCHDPWRTAWLTYLIRMNMSVRTSGAQSVAVMAMSSPVTLPPLSPAFYPHISLRSSFKLSQVQQWGASRYFHCGLLGFTSYSHLAHHGNRQRVRDCTDAVRSLFHGLSLKSDIKIKSPVMK